jgi:hypothetical protein
MHGKDLVPNISETLQKHCIFYHTKMTMGKNRSIYQDTILY